MNIIKGVLRIVCYLTLVLLVTLVQPIFLRTRFWRVVPHWYHRACAVIMGLKVIVQGYPENKSPLLFVSNHLSWLDITILGSLTKGIFIAKADVRGWPLFGWLASLQKTIFIERTDRSKIREQRRMLEKYLQHGEKLLLFPEGTSSDGTQVLPFKPALFSVAETTNLLIQPIALTCNNPSYAWHGDMTLLPHLRKVFFGKGFTVTVTFHDPVTIKEHGSRKALARHCQAVIADTVAAA